MITEEFCLKEFKSFKDDIKSQLIEIDADRKNVSEETTHRRLSLLAGILPIYSRNSLVMQSNFLDCFIKFLDMFETRHLNNEINTWGSNPYPVAINYMKAYPCLHQYDFNYDGFGLYIYSDSRYHCLLSAIKLIVESEHFVIERIDPWPVTKEDKDKFSKEVYDLFNSKS